MQCGFPNDGTEPDFTLYSVPVRDDNRYEFICRRGHKRTTIVQQDKFEILFEIAINAIADGYYRDAVASATSSLERFYEFFVRVICHTYKIPNSEFEEAWKNVKNMSERQLGIFIATYILHFRKAPVLMPSARVAFRNDVIHKGRIPTKEEAILYANDILGLAVPLLIEIKKTMSEAIQELTMERMKEHAAAIGQTPHSTMSIPSAISLTLALTEPHPITIEARLKSIEDKKYGI